MKKWPLPAEMKWPSEFGAESITLFPGSENAVGNHQQPPGARLRPWEPGRQLHWRLTSADTVASVARAAGFDAEVRLATC